MLKNLLFVFWFFLPAGLSNISAFLSSKIPIIKKFNFPMDFYLKFRKKRILGDHKTIRGFICGIFIAIAIVYLQVYLYNLKNWIPALAEITFINYNSINPLILGFLAGSGALMGDAVKSFFKRQINIPPGKSWIPFDEIDYIIGGTIFTAIYIRLTIVQYILTFVLFFILHFVFNYLGYFIKLKKQKL